MEAYEILSGRASALLPINSFLNDSVPRPHSNGHHWVGMDSDEVTNFITKAFLKSKVIQVAIYSCLHQRHEVGLNAGLQLILRCCMHNDVIASILCGLPSKLPITTVVSGGGDGTVVSEIFSILSIEVPAIILHCLDHMDSKDIARPVAFMCRCSSYFYTSLAKHEIISVIIDQCGDSDKMIKKFSYFAVSFLLLLVYDKIIESIMR